jgi:cytochrome c553
MNVSQLRTLYSRIFILCLLLTSPLLASSKDNPVPPDDLVYCTVCHGVNLMGNSLLAAPRLSGMAPWYVKQQLRSFKNGWRGIHEQDLAGLEMRPMAAALTEQQIESAAEFVASTASVAPAVTIKGDVGNGRQLYQNCLACHGSEGEGNEVLHGSPLAGLNDWYVKQQIENYQKDIRGHFVDDVYGKQMKAAAMVLSHDGDIPDVVSYIATLKPR